MTDPARRAHMVPPDPASFSRHVASEEEALEASAEGAEPVTFVPVALACFRMDCVAWTAVLKAMELFIASASALAASWAALSAADSLVMLTLAAEDDGREGAGAAAGADE